MKSRIISIIILLVSVFPAFSQDIEIQKAAKLFKNNDFAGAAALYEKIIDKNGESAEIFYNLGNCYYKENEIGLSVLNYERALRIKPYFDDARNNLALAQTKVVDNIIESPDFFLKNWVNLAVKLMLPNNWFIISIILFVVSLIAGFLFLFSGTQSFRKLFFYIGIVLLSFSVITLVFSGLRKDQMVNHNDAVIMSGVVIIKSSPDKSGTDLFQLHEGTKVKVKSSLGEWTEIKIGNGEIGWVETGNIKII